MEKDGLRSHRIDEDGGIRYRAYYQALSNLLRWYLLQCCSCCS